MESIDYAVRSLLEEVDLAWFRNIDQCYRCSQDWEDEWSCMCDDECPSCGARYASPVDSEDVTYLIERYDHYFVVLRSSDDAAEEPDYREVFHCLTRDLAQSYVEVDQHSRYPA